MHWLERVERRFDRRPALVALSGPYRFYDWDWRGRAADPRRTTARSRRRRSWSSTSCCGIGTLFYGGNFAVRREALARIGGFDTLDRVPRRGHEPRPPAHRRRARSRWRRTAGCRRRRGAIARWGRARCSGSTSATSGPKSCHHRPKDTRSSRCEDLTCLATNPFCSATSTSTRTWSDGRSQPARDRSTCTAGPASSTSSRSPITS